DARYGGTNINMNDVFALMRLLNARDISRYRLPVRWSIIRLSRLDVHFWASATNSFAPQFPQNFISAEFSNPHLVHLILSDVFSARFLDIDIKNIFNVLAY
ncbi:MAG: hypothetical protein QXJ13_07965, partial [Candidatus Bathyarchaeia archaeon]